MALFIFQLDKSKKPPTIQPGDVVFHNDPAEERFPLHVGVYIGTEHRISTPMTPLAVRGLPGTRGHGDHLGDSKWGEQGAYQVHSIGQRKDVEAIQIKEVVAISAAQMFEQSQIAQPCRWKKPSKVYVDYDRPFADGLPRFVRGTCAQFVEFLYEMAGIELLASGPETGSWPRKVTFDPEHPKRIYPATQMHIFYAGQYGLRTAWDPRYAKYPDCLFGERSSI